MDRRLSEALKVLGVPADSDRETMASAYRRLARRTHPDVSPAPDAAERFATVVAAYRMASGAPRPGRRAEAGTSSTDSSPRGSPPSSYREEPEDLADDWTSAAWDLAGAHMPRGLSSLGSAHSWRHPPIVAGPVVVRRPQPDAERRSGDG